MLMQTDDLDCFDMVICGNEISCKWDNDEKELTRRALREMQQKRLMNLPTIKKMKKQCQIAQNNYLCPICKTKNNEILQASHIWKPIIKYINDIVNRYIYTLSFYQLFNKVIEIEDTSLITIACRKCNKDLEEK